MVPSPGLVQGLSSMSLKYIIRFQMVTDLCILFRAFSAVGLFITKLRTRLSDDSIDDLSILRSHFQAQKKKK